ncbi:Arc family DNA-binding protein [Azotobacter beijerinckii]|uniref:Arc-like DNA binding domain-containing protein n=1 Tax=Azotobacter beijerinckii TaxID=170623 RepID=A0A1I0Z331_9GAMM|nr:Arc family DNA-binding protein [Azotobacter beijerinckii]SFB20035.1 Arc-like DNA binding domain-containing protein [Azotobacter beijerinckii]
MTDSRQADKFVIRLPGGMRDRIGAAAVAQHTSMNSLIILALESYLDGQEHQKILLEALSEKLERLEEA